MQQKLGSSTTKREALAGANKRGRNYHNGSSNDVSDDDACVLNYGSKRNKIGWRRNTKVCVYYVRVILC